MTDRKKYQKNSQPLNSVSDIQVAYQSSFHMATLSRAGVSVYFTRELLNNLQLTKQDLSSFIDISPKTLDRHYKSGLPFGGLQADRLLQLAALYNQGEALFAGKEKFILWLNSSFPALGNTKPKDWLDTQKGIEAISDELGKIEHGIFA